MGSSVFNLALRGESCKLYVWAFMEEAAQYTGAVEMHRDYLISLLVVVAVLGTYSVFVLSQKHSGPISQPVVSAQKNMSSEQQINDPIHPVRVNE